MTTTTGASVTAAYKISKGADRFRRRWQSEAEGAPLRFARRAYTPEGAIRLMARDVVLWERTERLSAFQRRRLWWVQTCCRIGWHQWHDRIGHGQTGRFCAPCGLTQSGDSGEPVRDA